MPPFVSEAARLEYFRAYDAMLARWPVEARSLFVDTSFGRTHVLEAGDTEAPPLLLLPTVSVSASACYANVGALSKRHRVLAVDIIGDAGRSELLRRPSDPAGYADRLAEMVSSLGLARPAVAAAGICLVGSFFQPWVLSSSCDR
jgi:hypothetical protein